MEVLVLICSIGGQRIALPADDIESIVEIDEVTPVPFVAAHVAGLFALRSRVLTIIDSLAALELGKIGKGDAMQAVIVAWEGHHYGLLVDQVDDVVTATAALGDVRAALVDGWARACSGTIDHEGESLLLINPAALIGGPAALAA